MSLSEAVMEIVGEMEQSVNDDAEGVSIELVHGWALALKVAAKMSKSQKVDPAPMYVDHRAMIDAEREKLRAAKEAVSKEENGRRMVQCVGGLVDGDWIEIAGDMPEGAYTGIGFNGVYQLKDGKLQFTEPATTGGK